MSIYNGKEASYPKGRRLIASLSCLGQREDWVQWVEFNGVSITGTVFDRGAAEEKRMLVLTRKQGERVMIQTPDGHEIVVTLVAIDTFKVKLGFDSPKDTQIMREELLRRGNQEKKQ
jgi:carbon storage regulator